jgi:hypothetical protein
MLAGIVPFFFAVCNHNFALTIPACNAVEEERGGAFRGCKIYFDNFYFYDKITESVNVSTFILKREVAG